MLLQLLYIDNKFVSNYKTSDYTKKNRAVIDSAISGIHNRFTGDGISKYQKMKSILLSGNVTPECEQYPEIDINSLKVQLSMFRSKHKYNSIADVRNFFKDMTQEV